MNHPGAIRASDADAPRWDEKLTFCTYDGETTMAIKADMQAWINNAEEAGDDKYGAAAELMREAIAEIDQLEKKLTVSKQLIIQAIDLSKI